MFANNTEQLNNIMKEFGRIQSNVFRGKLSRSIKLPNNAGDYLVQMALKEVAKSEGRTQARYGWNENTRCFFVKLYTEKQLTFL